MKLLNELLSAAEDNNSPAVDVRVGVSWTGVVGQYGGVCKTYGTPVAHGNYTRDMGKLDEKDTLELAEYARSWNLVEASIGVAALNSMFEVKGKDGNVWDIIPDVSKDKKVTCIGNFHRPYLGSIAKKLWIIESNPALVNPKAGIINEAAIEYTIPKSDVVIVTGSTLINKSMEHILELCRKIDAYTMVIGPSTTMSEVLFDYGVDMLAGVKIIRPSDLVKKISHSGGMINTKMCAGELVFKILEK